MAKETKREKFLSIYYDQPGTRHEKYLASEVVYSEKNGEDAYAGFRMFQAVLAMEKAKDVPFNVNTR